ncbi:MAG TPA: hypothetical protein VL551_00660 [Actinospica sp.]|jgi:hypothetical protein|nr:hypothetical protein [Actinospica sp.]
MFHSDQVARMYYVEQDATRNRRAEEMHRHRLAAQGRKLRKRDGRSENSEAGDHRPPAVDC